MRVGIVSDTHDNQDVIESAVELFTGDVDAVVHCGDVIAPFSVSKFNADFDFYAVRGNNDGEWALQDAVRNFGAYLGEMGELSLGGERVAVYHGTSNPIIEALVDSGSYDYVLHGHTHNRVHEERDGTVRINPGGIGTESSESEPPAGVVLDTETGDVTFHDLR
ncbi:YfcE family phosphodiesterase [Halovenus sp. WSH3]|uniref:Phosphoesterase n=1 Tax=Halovenus carboxidivorans TaxID=2692199 RepID=A0A6B0TIR3_9EURY|nr:metallophosphoesterase [Halovenus carboxidivorans]MXR53099.1 YfcE family phosphodiesterase [Halovenus carboxidivorans]